MIYDSKMKLLRVLLVLLELVVTVIVGRLIKCNNVTNEFALNKFDDAETKVHNDFDCHGGYCMTYMYTISVQNEKSSDFGRLKRTIKSDCGGHMEHRICHDIGRDGCLFGDAARQAVQRHIVKENVGGDYAAQEDNAYCCCATEKCNTVSTLMERYQAAVPHCYQYTDVDISSDDAGKKAKKGKCESDYCFMMLANVTEGDGGAQRQLARGTCTIDKICEQYGKEYGEGCLLGEEAAQSVHGLRYSATVSKETNRRTNAMVDALCCCKGNKCNTIQALKNRQLQRTIKPTKALATNKHG